MYFSYQIALMKWIIVFAFLTITGLSLYAQSGENVFYLKDNGEFVTSVDSADFIRVIEKADSGSVNFKLVEYFKNGKVKTLGSVSSFYPFLIYEGSLVRYKMNGAKEAMFNYQNNQLVDKSYLFFEDGALKKITEYALDDRRYKVEKTMYMADSLGNVMVKDGNGHFKEFFKSPDQKELLSLEGDYAAGFSDGVWFATNVSGTYWYKEQFDKGKFVSGESSKDGQNYRYTIQEEAPSYKKGIAAFFTYLKQNLKYPNAAWQADIQGKVVLNFVIEKDGSISDVKVARSLNPDLDAEAIRVLQRSTGWIPGKQHGFPVRVKFNIPVTFSISR